MKKPAIVLDKTAFQQLVKSIAKDLAEELKEQHAEKGGATQEDVNQYLLVRIAQLEAFRVNEDELFKKVHDNFELHRSHILSIHHWQLNVEDRLNKLKEFSNGILDVVKDLASGTAIKAAFAEAQKHLFGK